MGFVPVRDIFMSGDRGTVRRGVVAWRPGKEECNGRGQISVVEKRHISCIILMKQDSYDRI